MDINLFDFDLPKASIALRPVNPRDSARMLVVEDGVPSDKGVGDLLSYLKAGDVLVLNDTRVVPSRLHGKRGLAKVEATLHKRVDEMVWDAFARPAKKFRIGDVINFNGLMADVIGKGEAGEVRLSFHAENNDMMGALKTYGELPLPPYIAANRPVDERDDVDYQTVFSVAEGAVAAPTAGLHFTPEMLDVIREKGIDIQYVTLHVGAGTFLPVKVENTEDHKMHAEIGEITPAVSAALNTAREKGGRIVSVGTTSLRLLESAADDNGTIHPFKDETAIFITPGYKFKAVDVLMTNFHLPKSTLFMLVSAFVGLKEMHVAYAHAIDAGYRFYSYGDSSLLFPKKDHND
jgi:S-adenosylmethionine:tRNA ribosyltransferase-isomerase